MLGVGGSGVVDSVDYENHSAGFSIEALTVEGGNKLQMFGSITLPMHLPTMFIQLVVGLIGVFQTFKPENMAAGASGGPQQSGRLVHALPEESGLRDATHGL